MLIYLEIKLSLIKNINKYKIERYAMNSDIFYFVMFHFLKLFFICYIVPQPTSKLQPIMNKKGLKAH